MKERWYLWRYPGDRNEFAVKRECPGIWGWTVITKFLGPSLAEARRVIPEDAKQVLLSGSEHPNVKEVWER